MMILAGCPQCDRRVRVPSELFGRKVRCPGCGAVWVPPAAGAAAPPAGASARASGDVYSLAPLEAPEPAAGAIRPAEPAPPARDGPKASPPASGPQETCPSCGSFVAPGAVVCIDCGFNRQTGKQLRTVSRRFQRHWDSGAFPFWARVVVAAVLLPACAAPLLTEEPDIGGALLTAWALIFVPLLGTLKRIIITRNPDGRAVLVLQSWVAFIPCGRRVTDLEDYPRIRLGAGAGTYDWAATLYLVLLFLLCGIPGLIYALIRARTPRVTLEVVGDHGGPDVEPVLVYRGSSEATMRQIGDTLKEVAGSHYG